MADHTDYLTASDFYKFLQCPHWPYYDRFATPEEQTLRREFSEPEVRRMENGVAHETEIMKRLWTSADWKEISRTGDPEKDWHTTEELMKQGTPLIYQGTLTDGDWTGRPDLLERREGESRFGSWFYAPVDIKSSHAIEKYQKLQLTFYSVLLERLQGRFPAEPAIINRDAERISFPASELIAEFETVLVEIQRVRAREKPDPVLRKSCYDTGPWGCVCERFAKSTDDIALLYNVDVNKLRVLRGLGIRTIQDAAAMNPEALDGVARGLRTHGLQVIKWQAQALVQQMVLIRETVSLPKAALEIHFDIESDPPHDVDYLYGLLLLRQDGSREYHPFVARTLSEEGAMWRAFLDWLPSLGTDYVVYHFAVYECTRLNILEKRYGGSEWLEVFRSKMIDLKEITSHSITFPLYFYGLKYIAKFLGFSWRGDVKNGGHSVDVFEEYLATGRAELLQSIITYNEDDVRATAYLKHWLETYAMSLTSYNPPYPWHRDV